MKADPDAPPGTPAELEHSGGSDGVPRFAAMDGSRMPAGAEISPLRLWFHRLTALTFVFLCATLGVTLVVFPWRDEWAHNSLVFSYPWLQRVLASGFVRGMCSGLGLLDIWIGFWEAVHYHE